MNTNETYIKGYIKGWEEARAYICKIYDIDEMEVMKQEANDNDCEMK